MEYKLVELSIELSAQCQCRCIMCSSGSTPKALPNELSPEEVDRLIVEARNLGATILSLSGGDPILQWEIAPRYIRLALDIGYEQILFYTTGVIQCHNGLARIPGAEWLFGQFGARQIGHIIHSLDTYSEAADKLVFVFSLHSHHSPTHNYITGLDSFNDTISAISLVTSYGFQAWVHMVPMLPNWQDAPRLHQLCCELGVEKMSMLRYVPQTRGRANRRKLELNVDEFRDMQGIMADMLDQVFPYTQLRFGCPIDFRHTIDPSMDAKAKPCHAGTDLMLVRPNGSTHPCAAWKTLPDDSNVREHSLEEIWRNGHVFQAIRRFREEGWMDLGGPCASCRYLASCKGGCPAQKMHLLSIYNLGHSNMRDLLWPIADPMCPLNGCGMNWEKE